MQQDASRNSTEYKIGMPMKGETYGFAQSAQNRLRGEIEHETDESVRQELEEKRKWAEQNLSDVFMTLEGVRTTIAGESSLKNIVSSRNKEALKTYFQDLHTGAKNNQSMNQSYYDGILSRLDKATEYQEFWEYLEKQF